MNPYRSHRGFTLMELLAVIAIISLMAVVAISATNGATAGDSSKQGAIIASNVLALARNEAIQKQGYAVLLIDANQNSSNSGNYLHRMMVADETATSSTGTVTLNNNFNQVSVWYDLPTSVLFDPTYSLPTTPTAVTINLVNGQTYSGSAFVYLFTPAGQLASEGQLVFAVGHEPTPFQPLFEDGTSSALDTRQGFCVHLLGRPSFFSNPTSIPISTH